MKTKIPTIKNFIGGVLFGLLVVGLVVLSTGCSKKDKGGTRAGAPGWNGWNGSPGFPGYPGQGGGYGSGLYVGNETMGRYQLGIQLSSSGNQAIVSYGELFVATGIQCNGIYSTGMAPGIWQVRSFQNQPAQFQGDWISYAQLEAQGPGGYAILTITDAKLYAIGGQGHICSGMGGFDELSGIVRIEMVNNQPCGTTSYIDLQSAAPACRY